MLSHFVNCYNCQDGVGRKHLKYTDEMRITQTRVFGPLSYNKPIFTLY